jgi:ribosomal protein L24E
LTRKQDSKNEKCIENKRKPKNYAWKKKSALNPEIHQKEENERSQKRLTKEASIKTNQSSKKNGK